MVVVVNDEQSSTRRLFYFIIIFRGNADVISAKLFLMSTTMFPLEIFDIIIDFLAEKDILLSKHALSFRAVFFLVQEHTFSILFVSIVLLVVNQSFNTSSNKTQQLRITSGRSITVHQNLTPTP